MATFGSRLGAAQAAEARVNPKMPCQRAGKPPTAAGAVARSAGAPGHLSCHGVVSVGRMQMEVERQLCTIP